MNIHIPRNIKKTNKKRKTCTPKTQPATGQFFFFFLSKKKTPNLAFLDCSGILICETNCFWDFFCGLDFCWFVFFSFFKFLLLEKTSENHQKSHPAPQTQQNVILVIGISAHSTKYSQTCTRSASWGLISISIYGVVKNENRK